MQKAFSFAVAFSTLLVVVSSADSLNEQPDSTIFVPVRHVGSNESGTLMTMHGCTGNGATIDTLTVWANDLWIRGMQMNLTDGRQLSLGCLNVTQNATSSACNDSSIRSNSFKFDSGEGVSQMTLWSGNDITGATGRRAGYISFVSSTGRTFDFGMTASRSNPVIINTGSGVPCGISPLAGADIDAFGFVFLRNVTSSVLGSVTYSGVSNSQGGLSDDTATPSENITTVTLNQQVYNNTGKGTNLIASFEYNTSTESKAAWSRSTGVDSYLVSTVNAPLPQPSKIANSSNPSWELGPTDNFNRTEEEEMTGSWKYNVTVGPGGVSEVVATAVQGEITATYTGNLTVNLDSGASFAVLVQGTYQGFTTFPAGLKVNELVTPQPQSGSSSGGSSTGKVVGWVVGILVGVVVGILLAALVGWFCIQRRKRRDENDGTVPPTSDNDPKQKKLLPKTWAFVPGFMGGKGKEKDGVSAKDVEMGNAKGKQWEEEHPDDKLGAVMGIPVNNTQNERNSRQNGDLPETEGQYVVPYNMFRRLRLDAIRKKFAGERAKEAEENAIAIKDAVKEPEQNSIYQPPEISETKLSNPASEASTPRTIPEMGQETPIARDFGSGAESIHGASEADVSNNASGPDDFNKVELNSEEEEDDKRELVPSRSTAQSKALKERVRERMAQRRSPSPSPEPRPRSPNKAPRYSDTASVTSSNNQDSVLAKFTARNNAPIYHDSTVIIPGKQTLGIKPAPESKVPRKKSVLEHDDANLKLGEGYQSAEDAKSNPKNVIEMDNVRVKLGAKYNTQGRNE